MSNPVRSATIEFLTNLAKLEGDMGKASQIVDKTATKMERAFGEVKEAFLGIGELVAFGEIIKATADAESAFAQLESAVKSTGGTAGKSAEELGQFADSLRKVSTFSTTTIVQSESMMLTFTKIGKQIFPEAEKAALNLATRMKTDLKSATLQVGKALEDPISGMTALRKAGVFLDESQKALIKSLVKSGDLLDAQKIVLKELEKEMGGAALAARNTLGGALDAVKNSAESLFEKLGGQGSSGLSAILNSVASGFDFLAEHAKEVDAVLTGIAAGAGIMALAKLPETIEVITGLIETAIATMGAETALATGGLTLIVGGLVAAFVEWKDTQFKLGDETVTTWNLIRATWEQAQKIWATAVKDFWGRWNDFTTFLSKSWEGFSKDVASRASGFMEIWHMVAVNLGSVFTNIFGDLFKNIDKALHLSETVAGIAAKVTHTGEARKSLMAQRGMAQRIGSPEQVAQIDQQLRDLDDLDALKGVFDISKRAGQLTREDEERKKKEGKLNPFNGEIDPATGKAGKVKLYSAKEFRLPGYLDTQNEKTAELNMDALSPADAARKKFMAGAEKAAGRPLLPGMEQNVANDAFSAQQNAKLTDDLAKQTRDMQEQQKVQDLLIAGKRDEAKWLEQENSLRKKGIDLDHLSESSTKALDAYKKAFLAELSAKDHDYAQSEIEALDEQHKRSIESIAVGKEAAAIEEKIRQIKKQHKDLDEADLKTIRERLATAQQDARNEAAAGLVQQFESQNRALEEQNKEQELLNAHKDEQAALEQKIFKWQESQRDSQGKLTREMTATELATLRNVNAQEQLNRDKQEAAKIVDSLKTEEEKFADTQATLDRLASKGLLSADKFKDKILAIDPALKSIKSTAQEVGKSIESAFDNMIFKGGKFKDVIKQIGLDLAHIAEKKLILDPIEKGFSSLLDSFLKRFIKVPQGQGTGLGQGAANAWGGGGLNAGGAGFGGLLSSGLGVLKSGLSGGWGLVKKIFGFADGGRPPLGQPSLIGENGPELWMPDQAGTIFPNSFVQDDGEDTMQMSMFGFGLNGLSGLFGGGGGGGGDAGAGGTSTVSTARSSGGAKTKKQLALDSADFYERDMAQDAHKHGLYLQELLDQNQARKYRDIAAGGAYAPMGYYGDDVVFNNTDTPENYRKFGAQPNPLAMQALAGSMALTGASNAGASFDMSSMGAYDHLPGFVPGSSGALSGSHPYGNMSSMPPQSGGLGPYGKSDLNNNANVTPLRDGSGWTWMPNWTQDMNNNPSQAPGGHRYPAYPSGFGPPAALNNAQAFNPFSGMGPDSLTGFGLPSAGSSLHDPRQNSLPSIDPSTGQWAGYASGGRPMMNRPMIVGENGPETWIPDVPGRVANNAETDRTGGGGANIEVHNHASDLGLDIQTSRGSNGQTQVDVAKELVSALRSNNPHGREFMKMFGLRQQAVGR